MGILDEDIAEQERLTDAITKILARHDPATIMIGPLNDPEEYLGEAREIANWFRMANKRVQEDRNLIAKEIKTILERNLGVDCHHIDEISGEVQKLTAPEV